MAVGLAKPLTEMCTRDISEGWFKGIWCVGLKTLPPSFADCPEILGFSNSWSSKSLSRPVICNLMNVRVGV
jgi:hypothetical protein